jgi:hypothetical protein
MPNMSYCRFENTMSDLRDCLDHINRKAENEYDERARQQMIELFREISDDYEGDIVGYSENQY